MKWRWKFLCDYQFLFGWSVATVDYRCRSENDLESVSNMFYSLVSLNTALLNPSLVGTFGGVGWPAIKISVSLYQWLFWLLLFLNRLLLHRLSAWSDPTKLLFPLGCFTGHFPLMIPGGKNLPPMFPSRCYQLMVGSSQRAAVEIHNIWIKSLATVHRRWGKPQKVVVCKESFPKNALWSFRFGNYSNTCRVTRYLFHQHSVPLQDLPTGFGITSPCVA